MTNNGWISVEDRLPQASGKYLCVVKDKKGNSWTVPTEWSVEMRSWFGEFGENQEHGHLLAATSGTT
nr:MAG TPA: Protein of unknown function (DUF551) [Caudoviricetes sp.]